MYFSLYSCRVQVERSILLSWQGVYDCPAPIYRAATIFAGQAVRLSRKVHFDRRRNRLH